jgi:hypothetical protein
MERVSEVSSRRHGGVLEERMGGEPDPAGDRSVDLPDPDVCLLSEQAAEQN